MLLTLNPLTMLPKTRQKKDNIYSFKNYSLKWKIIAVFSLPILGSLRQDSLSFSSFLDTALLRTPRQSSRFHFP